MADAPWFRFFPSDWLNGTRGLSLSQVGLYITLVAMMYDHGKPITSKRESLARRCGLNLRQFSEALDVLIEEGKILETPEGLWNERVAREIRARGEKILKAKNAAAIREERKIQTKQGENSSDDDRTIIDGSSILDSRFQTLEEEDSCPKPASPPSGLFTPEVAQEQSVQKPKKRAAYPEDFETFWSQYPAGGRLDKKECGEFWNKMDPENREKAIAGIPAFKAWIAKQGPEYRVLYAIRYLRRERFNDLAVTPATGTAPAVDWDARLKYARDHGQWSTEKWGPMPGQPGCLAPREKLLPGDGVGWAEFRKAS
jgi:uncharacterized protein YdaU (DUF1376 family)